jgi:hypothetical protein
VIAVDERVDPEAVAGGDVPQAEGAVVDGGEGDDAAGVSHPGGEVVAVVGIPQMEGVVVAGGPGRGHALRALPAWRARTTGVGHGESSWRGFGGVFGGSGAAGSCAPASR